jgi:hypothetical protein
MLRTTTQPDNYGNYYVIISDGKVITLFIHLVLPTGQVVARKIGGVNIAERILYIKRNREKHLFLKNNSYGFNEHVLRTGKTFDKINFTDGIITAIIPVEYILQNGRFLFFKQLGYEKQLFITLEQIKQFVVKPIF